MLHCVSGSSVSSHVGSSENCIDSFEHIDEDSDANGNAFEALSLWFGMMTYSILNPYCPPQIELT